MAWVVVHAVLLSVVAAYERPSRVAAGSDLVRPMLVGQAGEHSTRSDTRHTHVTHTSHTRARAHAKPPQEGNPRYTTYNMAAWILERTSVLQGKNSASPGSSSQCRRSQPAACASSTRSGSAPCCSSDIPDATVASPTDTAPKSEPEPEPEPETKPEPETETDTRTGTQLDRGTDRDGGRARTKGIYDWAVIQAAKTM